MSGVKTISPSDGSLVIELAYAGYETATDAVLSAAETQRKWRLVPLANRIEILNKAVDHLAAGKAALAREISQQMGRPINQTPWEIDGMVYRARHMLEIAEQALSERAEAAPEGRSYSIRREALGVVFAITPWNYPYLTSVNIIIPALAAGNAVILKPSPQTPLIGERYAEAFKAAGLPEGLFTCLHLSPEDTEKLIAEGAINHVAFTGSVENGQAVEKAAAGRFLSVGLELGGKDAAYVRADADIENAVANLVDGAFFNSGQSCCGIERIYVAEQIHDAFVAAYVALVNDYKLGDPMEENTTLGPVVSVAAAGRIRGEIVVACAAGATAHIKEDTFPIAKAGTAYVAPQVLTNVTHDMPFMMQETFGPCVGIMPVASDEEAVALVNDSPYGLTASVWTTDDKAGLAVAEQLDVGTVYLNRCDALEPALAWTGVKNSGRGCTLSTYGYDAVTRPKSFNSIHSK